MVFVTDGRSWPRSEVVVKSQISAVAHGLVKYDAGKLGDLYQPVMCFRVSSVTLAQEHGG